MRFGNLFALSALAGFIVAPTLVYADGELTLMLPPSKEAQERRAEAERQNHPQTNPNSFGTSRTKFTSKPVSASRTRGTLPSRGGSARREVVVGRLGLLESPTGIHRGHSRTSPTLVTAEAGTYVAIKQEYGEWCGILMADGSLGWILRSRLKTLDYQVVSNAPSSYTNYGGNVPTGSDPGDIYPRSAASYFTGDPQKLIDDAYRYLGVKYVWGGNTFNGIDCSGFVKNVFGSQGFQLPRLGSEQMAYGVPVPKDQLQPGDRLYFGRRKERVGVTHTGLYIGNGYFIHASSSRKGVAVSHLSEAMFTRIYVCARR